MQIESLPLFFLLIFTVISFLLTLLVTKFSKLFFFKRLLDKDFKKPQAFHTHPITRSGGLSSILALAIFFFSYYFLFNNLFLDYIVIASAIFLLGFLDDIKINLNPSFRLILMIFILSLGIFFFNIKLNNVELIFLSSWLNNDIFNLIFILLCFLFIINGANLIDGFNGLLGIHLLLINSILFFLNLYSFNFEFSFLLIAQIIIILSFLIFNFPKAKIFLGDSGSYFFGTLTVLNVIKTNNLNAEVSSFFFCIILFYLFFEVFFSFFRKIYLKKSPLRPDNMHLHMLSFNFLKKKKKRKDCNYLNSLALNSIYAMLVLPSFFFRNDGLICRYWFFTLILLYLLFYLRLYSFVKK